MTNWKCNCGVINFSTDELCKKCQSRKPEYNFSSQQPAEYFETHSADEGNAAIGILKAVAIATALGSVGFAGLLMTTTAAQDYKYASVVSAFIACAGIVLASFVYGFAVLVENVVALRKNSQHLAGIRADSANQAKASWQG